MFERGLESEPVGGEILFGVGGLTNSKSLLACIGYHPAPQEGTEKGMTKSVKSSLVLFQNKHYH